MDLDFTVKWKEVYKLNFFTLIKASIVFCVFILAACAGEKVADNTSVGFTAGDSSHESFMKSETSICANPSILAVNLKKDSHWTVLIGDTEVNLLGNRRLLGDILIPKNERLSRPFIENSEACWDKSILKIKTRALEQGQIKEFSFHIKSVEMDGVEAISDYDCSSSRILIYKGKDSADQDIEYKLCNYTRDKILSEGLLEGRPLAHLRACNAVFYEKCFQWILAQRQRIIDLEALDLLTALDDVDLKELSEIMQISATDAEVYKVNRSYVLRENYENALKKSYAPIKDYEYLNFKPANPDAQAAKELEQIFIISLQAQQAIIRAMDK